MSIKGLKTKNEINHIEINKKEETKEHLSDSFTIEDVLLHWNKYESSLEQQGKHIFKSYMSLSEPILMGTNILLEFPNKGSKDDFENTNFDLLNYLKINLRNYDLKIKITVIETYKPKVIYSNDDKYKHFKELNKNIELLRNTFELDI